MSLPNEDQNSQDNVLEKLHQVQKKTKILYTREFLLSLSDLDICKKLPSGFDESILSEFEDALQSLQDRPRNPGSFPLQGFRRNEYGSSPPTRGDSSNYSRGTYGRWESRSSGRSDLDSDSQSDKDSDSGRRYGHQSRRSWQTPEHDGLLGSGSFPRPSGYAAGISAAKVRANENYQLSKKNEPYQPPRPYKAMPHSRRETDSFNDETFGSMEYTSEDRAEEEKRRRDSFESMRKEQQKSLQEKQKLSLEKHKAGNATDLCEFLEGSKEEKGLLGGYNELDVSTATPVLNNESDKSSFSSHASRPPVPPGFTNTLEKSSGTKSLIPPPLEEIGKPVAGERLLYFRANPVQNGNLDGLEKQLSKEITSVDGQTEDKSKRVPFPNKEVNSHSRLGVPNEKVSVEDQCDPTSLSDDHGILNDLEVIELNAKELEDTVVGKSKKNYSSFLENKFGSALTMNDGDTVDPAKHHNGKVHDTWSPKSTQSSKFAQWFFEEEAQPANDISSGRPNDLLSLIVTGDKGRSQASVAKAEHFTHECSYESSELTSELTFDMPSATNHVSEEVFSSNVKEVTSTVLTCEDLEQSILSEYSQKNSNTMPLLKGWSASGTNIEQPREHDDHASQHLLSLLQKGSDPNTMTLIPSADIDFGDKILVSEEHDVGTAVDEPKAEEYTKNIHNSEKTLTLETLFGTAFMKELQSVEAPVSVQRGSNGSARIDALEPHGLSLPIMDNGVFSTVDEIGLQRTSRENNVSSSNHRELTKLAKAGNWLGFDDCQMNSSKHSTEEVSKHGGYNREVEFQLPEEESLISVGDSLNPQLSTLMPTRNSSKNELLSSKAHVDIAENLAAMGAVIKDKRTMVGPESLPFARGPYEQTDPEAPYHNIQVQPSLPQFQPPRMTHGRQLFHPLDSHPAHTSLQKKFMGPESMFNHDVPANSQFPANIVRPSFHHPSAGVAGYDLHAHHSMLHPMQMSGNRPQLLPDFPRGAPVPYSGNQPTGFIQDMNPMQGFPVGSHQPNIGSLGMSVPAPDNSFANPPEALQRLIEMELQANSKRIHPFRATHNQGINGHELDIRFPR